MTIIIWLGGRSVWHTQFAAEMADCFIDVIGSLGVERANELKV